MVVDKLSREIGRDTLAWQQDAKRHAMVAKVGDVVLVKGSRGVMLEVVVQQLVSQKGIAA